MLPLLFGTSLMLEIQLALGSDEDEDDMIMSHVQTCADLLPIHMHSSRHAYTTRISYTCSSTTMPGCGDRALRSHI